MSVWQDVIRTGDIESKQAVSPSASPAELSPPPPSPLAAPSEPSAASAPIAPAPTANPYAPPGYGAAPPAAFVRPRAPVAHLDACQACGNHAPTKRVTFLQNVGVLVMRFHKTVNGNLCRRCIDSYFWRFTLVSFFFGWWGVISFFFTCFIIPSNTITYLSSLDLPEAYGPDGSTPTNAPRGTILMVFGGLFGLVTLLGVALGLLALTAPDPDARDGGIFLAVTFLVLFGVPAALMIFFGVRRRKRANALVAASYESSYLGAVPSP